MLEPGLVRDVWEPNVNGDSFLANLSHYDAVELHLSAGPERKFMVDVPDDVCEVALAVNIMYRNLGTGDMGTFPDRKWVTLENVWGGPAVQDYLLVYIGQQGNVIKAEAGFTIQGDMTFTGARFFCEYTGGIPAPNLTKTYTLEAAGTYTIFAYTTYLQYDPGVFAVVADQSQRFCPVKLAADFDRDCRVDFRDFAIFCLAWLECTAQPPETCW
ncbi:MAG: hypothetical protein ACYS76_04860 [Planctomycetota bacterium]